MRWTLLFLLTVACGGADCPVHPPDCTSQTKCVENGCGVVSCPDAAAPGAKYCDMLEQVPGCTTWYCWN